MKSFGTDIVGFEAKKLIGKGGFCRVFEGNMLNETKDPVAIKAVSFLI